MSYTSHSQHIGSKTTNMSILFIAVNLEKILGGCSVTASVEGDAGRGREGSPLLPRDPGVS